MKATKNIADRSERSQKSLLRKIADFVAHPSAAGFNYFGPGSLATGQFGAYAYGADGIEYRGSVSRAICASEEECLHADVASGSTASGFALSAEF